VGKPSIPEKKNAELAPINRSKSGAKTVLRGGRPKVRKEGKKKAPAWRSLPDS